MYTYVTMITPQWMLYNIHYFDVDKNIQRIILMKYLPQGRIFYVPLTFS